MYLTYCCLHLTQLPYDIRVIQPHKECFVGHSDERMEERINAVSKAKKHVLALIVETSYDNQENYYDSSSEYHDSPVYSSRCQDPCGAYSCESYDSCCHA